LKTEKVRGVWNGSYKKPEHTAIGGKTGKAEATRNISKLAKKKKKTGD